MNFLEICGVILLILVAAILFKLAYTFLHELRLNFNYAKNVFNNRETYEIRFPIGYRVFTFKNTFYDNPKQAKRILYRLAWRELFS